jgi:serine/threonine-protein kinase
VIVSEAAVTAEFADATEVSWRRNGANGDVYLVRRPAGARAVKVMAPGLDLPRLQREIDSLKAVTSPYVVAYRSHGTISEGGTTFPYIEMDWIDGEPLDQALARVRTWDLAKRIEFIAQILEGADAIGRSGVVHRDIKLGNIIVGGDDRPIIVDLGWARIIEATTITASWQGTGTVPFNSPEQMRLEKVDARSDLFSIGILAYYVVTGSYPFNPTPTASLVELLQKGQPTVSLLTDPSMTDELARVVERLIAAAPARRPRTGAIAADELRGALRASPPPLRVFARPVFLPFLGSQKRFLRTGFFDTISADGLVGNLRLNVANHITGDLAVAAGLHVLVDPSSHLSRLARASAPRGYRSHHLPELFTDAQLGQPADVTAFVTAFFDVERNAGAAILVSPYFNSSPTDLTALAASLQFATAGLQLMDRPMLAGVSLHEQQLANDTLRPPILDLLTGSDAPAFYVLINDEMTDFRQTDDAALLTGMKDLVETLRQNRQAVFFARLGTVGLCLVAAGASGFSCGYEARNMHYAPDAPAQTGGGVPVGRYYEPELLSFLRYTESRDARSRTDPQTHAAPLANCACTFCVSAGLMGTGAWNDDASRRHQMLSLTNEVRELALLREDQRRGWLAARLSRASRARAALGRTGPALAGDSATPTYQVWRDVFVGQTAGP